MGICLNGSSSGKCWKFEVEYDEEGEKVTFQDLMKDKSKFGMRLLRRRDWNLMSW